ICCAPERLSFAAPKLVRSGPIEPETLARVIRGLDLTPDAITTANWVDNGSGWLAIMLRSREEVLAVLCQSQYGCNPEITTAQSPKFVRFARVPPASTRCESNALDHATVVTRFHSGQQSRQPVSHAFIEYIRQNRCR